MIRAFYVFTMIRYWEVMSNNVGNKMIYRVGRKLRFNEPLHSGNVEFLNESFDNYEDALSVAEEKNEKIKNHEEW